MTYWDSKEFSTLGPLGVVESNTEEGVQRQFFIDQCHVADTSSRHFLRIQINNKKPRENKKTSNTLS